MPPDVAAEVLPALPLEVRWSESRPRTAHVAVKFRGGWFYIDESDIRSKRTFVTLLVLFELQAPDGATAAPLLTLPAG